MKLIGLYKKLYDDYGPQGWWPLLEVAGINPTKTGTMAGYHIGVYDYPRTERQRFEICLGAILTQNTAWSNVEKALSALDQLGAIDPEKLLSLPDETLRTAIRPSGYFNAKAKKLICFARWYLDNADGVPARGDLLGVWGIGPETADSILLYAYSQPEMVVDTYTRRVLGSLGFAAASGSYDGLKAFCCANLPPELIVYQEYHALLVEHAKRARGGDRERGIFDN